MVEKMGKQFDVATEYVRTVLEHDAFATVLARLR